MDMGNAVVTNIVIVDHAESRIRGNHLDMLRRHLHIALRLERGKGGRGLNDGLCGIDVLGQGLQAESIQINSTTIESVRLVSGMGKDRSR